MIKAILQRFETGDQGTFGHFVIGKKSWFSGELPWENNEANVSCIPTGTYNCVWSYSPKFRKNTYHVHVPGRTVIEIHPSNFMGSHAKGFLCQLNGCIALGEKFGIMEKQKAVLVSRPAISDFETLMDGQPFTLEVK